MKKYILITLLIIPLLIFTSSKNKIVDNLYTPSKSSVLELKGVVAYNETKAEKANIKLYQGNNVVGRHSTKKNGKFQFVLFSNFEYMIEIEKSGFITERISISTINDGKGMRNSYLFEFWVDLMSESEFKGVDVSSLDFPTALIKYNYEEDEYIHDKEYSNQVKKDLFKLKERAANQ